MSFQDLQEIPQRPMEEVLKTPWAYNHYVYDGVNTDTHIDRKLLRGILYFRGLREDVTVRGLTQLISVDGRHRSGKSATAAYIACLWDKKFEERFEQRIITNTDDFFRELEYIEKYDWKNPVLMIDESGVSMGQSNWYEKWMDALQKTMQAFGIYHPTIMFCAPVKDFIDSRLRKMFHTYWTIKRSSNDYTTLIPYKVSYSATRSKSYYPKPVIRVFGQKETLQRINIAKPPDSILLRYQKWEQGFKPKLLKELRDQSHVSDMKEAKDKRDLSALIDMIIKTPDVYTKEGRFIPEKMNLNVMQIKYSCGISRDEADFVRNEARRILRNKYDSIKPIEEE